MDEQDTKRELAKLKRLASDVSSAIHDLVEDRFWTDYRQLEDLSREAIEKVEAYLAFKKEHNL